jgi:hypothetical protein
MPFEWNNTWVVTVEDLVPIHYNTLASLKKSVSRYRNKEYGIKQVQIGGNGRKALYDFYSLDVEIQNAMGGDPKKVTNPLELFYKTDRKAVDFFTSFRFGDETALSLEYQDEYITNASVLRAAVELKMARENDRKSKGGSCKGVMTSICNDVVLFNKILKTKHQVQHTLPGSEKRFKEVFREFENGFNYSSLIKGTHQNQNRRVVKDELLQLLNDLFATQAHKPTRTEVSKQYEAFISGYIELVNHETGELYDPKQFKALSDSTILNYLARWQDKISTYKKRSGDRQIYMGEFKTYHSLDKPTFAGSIISIDDRQPPFKYDDNNRVWFYMGIDLASECWIAAVHGKSKEGIITDFYRKLVRNFHKWGFNMPAELECELSLNSSFINTFLQEGRMFQYVRMEANKARAKRIERYFRDLRYGDEKEREGWIARHHAGTESNQAGPGKVPVIPYKTIVENSLLDIERWNNQPHSVYTDKSRWEVFCEMQNPDLKPTNWNAILPHIGYMTETSCQLNGIIHLNNDEYLLGMDGEILLGERLITMMKRVAGEKVDVYWLDDEDGKIIKAQVFLHNRDTMICEAIVKPRYNRARIEQTEKDREAMQIISAYAATIEAYGQRKAANINRIMVIDNRPEPERKFKMDELAYMRRDEQIEKKTEVLPEAPEPEEDPVPAYTGVKNLRDRF